MFKMNHEVTRFEMRPLGACVEILDRLRKPLNSEARRSRNGPIPYFGANGQLDTVDAWIFDEELVLVAEDGGFFLDPIRPISYRISGKAWVNNHAHVLRPLEHMDVDWLNYSIGNQDVSAFIKGATLKKLNQAELKRIPVPCPPIAEQRRIVARIKECMERVEEVEGLQDDISTAVDHLPRAARYDLWESMSAEFDSLPLADVTYSTKNGLYKPRKFHGSGALLLRMFNINGASFDLSREQRVQVTDREATDYAITNGDIIVSRVNSRELVGKSAIVSGLTEPAVHEAMLIRVRVDELRTNKDFLVAMMNSPQFLDDLRGRAKHAIGQSSINQNDLLTSLVPMPPLAQQDEAIESLFTVWPMMRALGEVSVERAKMVAGLRDAILRKAFAGEL